MFGRSEVTFHHNLLVLVNQLEKMKQPKIDWPEAIKPLLKKYKNTPHPLQSKNLYQQLVMVVLWPKQPTISLTK